MSGRGNGSQGQACLKEWIQGAGNKRQLVIVLGPQFIFKYPGELWIKLIRLLCT